MEPMNNPQLQKVLREWRIENAPRSLDERVLGKRRPWWMLLIRGSVRVPAPIALGFAVIFVVMAVALLHHPRQTATLERSSIASSVNLSEFQPVRDVQVRIIRKTNADQ